PFSPLFIGEYSATCGKYDEFGPPRPPFSPLFIGEYSATNMSPAWPCRLCSLSVPSSSGNTLQRKMRALPTSSVTAFQSPLHRGILCNNPATLTAQERLVSFSPLFIGEYSATRIHRARRRRDSRLSVPSSSGNTLQRGGARHRQARHAPFSPLFIGEYSATAAARTGVRRGMETFSPLFIGEYSATIIERPRCASSTAPFSPLFIGEYSATRGAAGVPATNPHFQSPLHRGILCNSTISREPSAVQVFQSPLHRGILCNARIGRCSRPIQYFQSPLHRGILCNLQAAQRPGFGPRLSVPSSSGNTLQRAQRAAGPAPRRPFSPLFIGEYSATARDLLHYQQVA